MIKTVVKIWNTNLKYGNIIIPFHSRNSTGYFVQFAKTGTRIKTIQFSGPWLWNQLTTDIKESKSLPIIKSQLNH